jgi:protein-L-isoaspartate(D-aspartate) O-methyltransferase
MIFLSGVKRGDSILEIGTGTGYEAAILYEMGLKVYTIEIDPYLAASARDLFTRMEYSIKLYEGNGIGGLEEHAPYSGIIIAASIPRLALISSLRIQLSPGGGRLVAPVGKRHHQMLTIIERKHTCYATWSIDEYPVSFVPLVPGLSS